VIKLISCFIFIKTKAGFVESIIKRLKHMQEVKEVWAVTGNIDVITLVEGNDITVVSKVILSKIHQIDGVERTATHIVAPI
jgi:DNA-binding Lrp family transcriptional regulator